MKNILKKIFCLHKWKIHKKVTYEYIGWNQSRDYETVEILICECCGKIKKINY